MPCGEGCKQSHTGVGGGGRQGEGEGQGEGGRETGRGGEGARRRPGSGIASPGRCSFRGGEANAERAASRPTPCHPLGPQTTFLLVPRVTPNILCALEGEEELIFPKRSARSAESSERGRTPGPAAATPEGETAGPPEGTGPCGAEDGRGHLSSARPPGGASAGPCHRCAHTAPGATVAFAPANSRGPQTLGRPRRHPEPTRPRLGGVRGLRGVPGAAAGRARGEQEGGRRRAGGPSLPRRAAGIKPAASFPGVCNIHLNIYLEQIHFNEFSVKLNQLIRPRLGDQKCKARAGSGSVVSALAARGPGKGAPARAGALRRARGPCTPATGAGDPSTDSGGDWGLRGAEEPDILGPETAESRNPPREGAGGWGGYLPSTVL